MLWEVALTGLLTCLQLADQHTQCRVSDRCLGPDLLQQKVPKLLGVLVSDLQALLMKQLKTRSKDATIRAKRAASLRRDHLKHLGIQKGSQEHTKRDMVRFDHVHHRGVKRWYVLPLNAIYAPDTACCSRVPI